MSLVKKDIVNNISCKAHIPKSISIRFLEKVVDIIKTESKNGTVKLSNFGNFSYKKSPSRIGRNPKNKTSYKIKEMNKLNFYASSRVKKFIN